MRVEAGLLIRAGSRSRPRASSLSPFPAPLSLCPSSLSPCPALAGTGLFWFIECRARRACVETVKCAMRLYVHTHARTSRIMLTAVSKTCMSLVSC